MKVSLKFMFTILRVTQVYWMNWMLTKIEHLLSTTKCPFNETMPSANKFFVNLLWWDFWSIENWLNLDPTVWIYQLFYVEIINKIYLYYQQDLLVLSTRFTCLVEYKPVKQEVSPTVILPSPYEVSDNSLDKRLLQLLWEGNFSNIFAFAPSSTLR